MTTFKEVIFKDLYFKDLYLYFYIYILKICTNDYDNHEYLAVKKLDFLPGISYDVCNEMFINEEKRWHENEATIPT